MASLRVQYAPLSELLSGSSLAEHWLSPQERSAWHAMRSPERQRTWLAGRVLAKRLLRQALAFPPADDCTWAPATIHIDSRSAQPGHGERPLVFIGGKPTTYCLSIAHTSRGVLAAVAKEPDMQIGVDLVEDDVNPARLHWAFTPAERDWLAQGSTVRRREPRLWAMKESLYKACQQGEGFTPARIEVVPGSAAQYPGLDETALRILQSWRIDGHWASLAVVDVTSAGSSSKNIHPLAWAA